MSVLVLTGCAHPVRALPGQREAASPAREQGRPGMEMAAADVVKPPDLLDLGSLKDLTGGELAARLGPPDFTRREPPGEIWQYRSPSCVMDVFLFPENGDLRVAHVVTRSRDQANAPKDECLPVNGIRAGTS